MVLRDVWLSDHFTSLHYLYPRTPYLRALSLLSGVIPGPDQPGSLSPRTVDMLLRDPWFSEDSSI